MSLSEIRNVVLLFSNPVWAGTSTTPTTIIRNITALSSQIAYEQRISSNITTLTTTNADTLNGVIQGLLYVPDISRVPSCDAQQYDFIPQNVTRRVNLPPTNYNLIALAPWFSINCTIAYLNSARADPIRAFLFYRPNESSNKPQDVNAAVWDLDDGGAWRKQNQYPIFAVSGLEGQKMMLQLSLYSGSVDQIPHGTEITSLYGPNPKDYVRIWTELTMKTESSLPALWSFFLIIIGALLLIVSTISVTMHLVQRRRRESLRRRVQIGEVDLEAMGIKRLTVPEAHIRSFPLFTYNQDPDGITASSTPTSPGGGGGGGGGGGFGAAHQTPSRSRSSRKGGRRTEHSRKSTASDTMSPGARSIRSSRSMRSKRSNFTGSDTTATNFQPNCHICLVAFKHRVTVIRELPCCHIFHPYCIDEFLSENSSLCPMCKHCMLPKGYSPPITNGMVRRERALRRLRERVDVDYLSVESGESRFKGWKRRLFTYSSSANHAGASSSPPHNNDNNQNPNNNNHSSGGGRNNNIFHLISRVGTTEAFSGKHASKSSSDAAPDTRAGFTTTTTTTTTETALPIAPEIPISIPGLTAAGGALAAAPPVVKKATKPRKTQPRNLRVLPTQHEDVELTTVEPGGRFSPSSFARERMREIASENAPFDDPDQQRPKWRRVISSIFPGFT